MKTQTTTSRAYTTEERRANRRAEVTAIFTDYIKANRNKDWYFSELYQELLYADAEKAVYIALRARHSKSGLQFLADLQNAQKTDQTARNNRTTAEELTHLEKMHKSHREGFELFNRRANRLTLSDFERALAFTLAEDFKHKAEREQQQINALSDVLDLTLSDRADLVQVALVKMLELEQTPAEITATILATFGATTEEELTEEDLTQAQATANFRAVINSVGRAINDLATPEVLNRTTTKAVKIEDLDEVTDFILKYGGIGDDYKAPHTTKRARASDCYITIEERHTATQDGYYKIYHYKTVAPYQYIEDFNTADDTENDIAYIKTYNPFVSNSADLDRIEELYNRANLTDRQRLFLQEFAKRCRYDGDFQSVKQYAFNRIGITTRANQDVFFHRLKKALNK